MRTKFLRTRFVAIHASDAAPVHPALQNHSPAIDLVPVPTVCLLVRGREHCQVVTALERGAGSSLFTDVRMAGEAWPSLTASGSLALRAPST